MSFELSMVCYISTDWGLSLCRLSCPERSAVLTRMPWHSFGLTFGMSIVDWVMESGRFFFFNASAHSLSVNIAYL